MHKNLTQYYAEQINHHQIASFIYDILCGKFLENLIVLISNISYTIKSIKIVFLIWVFFDNFSHTVIQNFVL